MTNQQLIEQEPEILLGAIEEVLAIERKPLSFQRIAEGAGIDSREVYPLLSRAMLSTGASITFRYPPLPEAAVVSVIRRDR